MPGGLIIFLRRVVSIRPGERRLVAWAWLYLFSVFTAYYVIRPIRDEAGVAGGVDNLSWLFTGTLLAMMAVIRRSRRWSSACHGGALSGSPTGSSC